MTLNKGDATMPDIDETVVDTTKVEETVEKVTEDKPKKRRVAVATPIVEPAIPVYHKVQRGDNLYNVAMMYGKDYETVLKLNDGKTEFGLGSKIRIS